MAVQANDGSFHHSAGRASLHNETSKAKPKPAVKQMEKPKAGGDGEASSMSIEDHVKQHGPAHEMHYHHDTQADTHHVVSHHGDGGEGSHHRSTHKSHQEAHDHMAKAFGLGGDQEETPDNAQAEADEDQQQPQQAGGGNPFLS